MIKRILNKLESIYYYKYFSSVKDGASNTLLKKIYKSTDIDFIQKVFHLDFFREIIEPMEYEIKANKNVIVFAPHQDDELIGLGGTLIQLKNKGAAITLVFLTDGADLVNQSETVQIRSLESQKVARELNASIINIGIPNDTMEVNFEHLNKIRNILLSQKWDDVFCIWPIDNPPKHRICAFLLGKVISKMELNLILYSVHTDLIPNLYSNITKQIIDKELLIKIYKSQLSAQAYDHLAQSRDGWNSRFLPVSCEKRYVELFYKVSKNEYMKLMKIFEQVNTHELFKGNENCIKTFHFISKNF